MLKVIENSAIGSGVCQQQYCDPILKDEAQKLPSPKILRKLCKKVKHSEKTMRNVIFVTASKFP